MGRPHLSEGRQVCPVKNYRDVSSMPGKEFKCKNCGGIGFKKIGVNTYQCMECGQTRKAPRHANLSTNRRTLPKESITTTKYYKPLVAHCERCGEKIDRIGHPNDERRLNNKWGNHVCSVTSKTNEFYS